MVLMVGNEMEEERSWLLGWNKELLAACTARLAGARAELDKRRPFV